MLNFNSILIFSENPQELVEFYCKILEQQPVMSMGDFSTLVIGPGAITIGPHDKVHGQNHNPERVMWNFETDDVSGNFDRIKNLGAKVIQEPYHPGEASDMWLATFADPDNNYFQLASPWDQTSAAAGNS